jgi:hypothetical protein
MCVEDRGSHLFSGCNTFLLADGIDWFFYMIEKLKLKSFGQLL